MEMDPPRESPARNSMVRRVALLLMGAVLLVGCGPTPYNGDVTVTAGPQFKESSGLLPTVQVDVIGASALELERWKSYPVTDYWQVDDQLRKTVVKHSFVLMTDDPGPFVLSRWSGQYDAWKKAGVTSLVLIADLPGAWQKRPADAKGKPPAGVRWYDPERDPRRLVIPWVQEAYGFFTNDVLVALEPTGLTLKTPVDMSKAVPAAGN